MLKYIRKELLMKTYTVKEVADILKLNQETIRRYLRNGKLKGINHNGGNWRITHESLEKYLKGE
jgi:excisionase family DNA binding protein